MKLNEAATQLESVLLKQLLHSSGVFKGSNSPGSAHAYDLFAESLAGPLRLGVIYTIGPYLLPDLVRNVIKLSPQMPLILQMNGHCRRCPVCRSDPIKSHQAMPQCCQARTRSP